MAGSLVLEDLLPDGGVLRALTLWPEWVWAFIHLGKRTENRGWSPPEDLLRRGLLLAIHGGAHLGGRAGAPARNEAVAAVRGMFRAGPVPDGWVSPAVPLGAYAGKVAAVGVVRGWDRTDGRTRWDVPGAVHWRIPRVYVLEEPVVSRGAQGLWIPDEELGERLLASRVREAPQPFAAGPQGASEGLLLRGSNLGNRRREEKEDE